MNDSNGCNIRSKSLSRPISSVEDCALENFVDHWELRALAQLRPAAAGLERSAAHLANEVGPSKMSVHRAVHARTLTNLRQGWKPAGPRPSNIEINSEIEMGSVYDSPVCAAEVPKGDERR